MMRDVRQRAAVCLLGSLKLIHDAAQIRKRLFMSVHERL